MVTIKRIKCSIVNCYLVKGDNGSVLVDACNPGDGDAILAQLAGETVNLILLTHGHTDHIGSAAFLKDRLHAPIAMHEADAELITHPNARKLYGHTFLGRILAQASESTMASAAVPPFSPDIWLCDGSDLAGYGIAAHVIALCGHTAGSIGVLTADNDLLAGDAAFHMMRPTGARIYEDRVLMEQSVAKMKQCGAKTIYVGHGDPITPAML